MEIKYNKKKQQLRRDPVVDGLTKAQHYFKENTNSILSAVIVMLLLVGGFSAYNYVKKSGQEHAQEAFGKAMVAYASRDRADAVEALSIVADKHRNAPQAAYAAFMLGHLYLEQGSYDEAATWFDVAAQHKKAGFVAGEALEGLALSYEAKGQVEKAVEYLEKALEKKSLAYRYPELRWKLALLNRRLGRYEQTRSYCKAIVNDTLATKMKQKAQNLLVEIKLM